MALNLKPVNYDKLPEQEKEAFDNIFPRAKYNRSSPAFSVPEIRWNEIKSDYESRYKDYMAFFHRISSVKYWTVETNIRLESLTNVFKKIDLCTMSVTPRENKDGKWSWTSYESARKESNTFRFNYTVHSLEDIYNALILKYSASEENTDSAIDIGKLKHDLDMGLLFFTIDDNKIESELSDFFFMSKFLSTERSESGSKEIAPYNKCRALFRVLHYMKRDTACINLLNNMGLIMGTFNGMISSEELLLPPSDQFASAKQVEKLSQSFPTLIDMQESHYKFIVLNNIGIFLSAGSRVFSMNKISYYDFAEQFEGVKNEYENYLESIIFTFKLLIPDQENFKLAKQIGFIDSNVIDWTFWYREVILRQTPKEEDFFIESHYKLLLKFKRGYFNFFSNLGSDYYKKLLHEPVSLVFNIAAVVFAIAGVIQVLQQAGVIPSLAQSSGSGTSG